MCKDILVSGLQFEGSFQGTWPTPARTTLITAGRKLPGELCYKPEAPITYYWCAKALPSRLACDSPRTDFLTNMIAKVEAGEVDLEELTAHASTLVYGYSYEASVRKRWYTPESQAAKL